MAEILFTQTKVNELVLALKDGTQLLQWANTFQKARSDLSKASLTANEYNAVFPEDTMEIHELKSRFYVISMGTDSVLELLCESERAKQVINTLESFRSHDKTASSLADELYEILPKLKELYNK